MPLKLTLPAVELYNEVTEEFITIPGQEITCEHSLISMSKWESKFKTPLLASPEFDERDLRTYLECMCITRNVAPELFAYAPASICAIVSEYLMDSHTATTISKEQADTPAINPETVTSELVYYWMVALSIPFETEKWNLNRLIMLIEVCNHKMKKPQKRSWSQIVASNKALNVKRRAELNSKG